MKSSKLKFTLPWIFYSIALISYIVFNLMEVMSLGISKTQITNGCLLLVTTSIFFSLSTILSHRHALGYIVFWLLTSIIAEYIYIANGRFTHDEGASTIFGIVPAMIAFNWLIIFFATYTLSTFTNLLMATPSNSYVKLFRQLSFDGLIITTFALLFEPIGHIAGYYTWDNVSANVLVWDKIPLSVFFEYFFGGALVMLPLRSWEVFKFPPKKDAFISTISFPLYFGWSFYAALTYWAFRKEIEHVGNFGLILLAIVSIGIVAGQRRLRKIN